MSIKYIVTGGAGFIGSNLVRELNARGEDEILIVDELGEDEKWKNLVGLAYEDYIDKEDLFDYLEGVALKKVKAVYHLGACSATTETDADYLAYNNYHYTRALCESCLDAGVRFVYASSAATYGDGNLGYSDADAETPKFRPLNMYGYSKHMFDLWALRNGALKEIAGLKYFNVYGPGEAHKGDMRSVVHKSFEQILASGKVQLFKSNRPDYKDGEQVRDFIYVKDAVDMTLWLGERPSVGGLFNCGTGTPRTWVDLVSAVFNAMGIPVNIEFVDMPPHLEGKYQYHTCAVMDKIRTKDYPARFQTLESGINDYVRNHLMS
ncbi:MAG: ADP-glyceromanno-heptose 6-epimerase [Verrucomicrobia bacterium]|nr:ADP-glyceromanno-heptose 6-epimerase [Verrucomicrobiota bacterium]